MNDHRWSKFWWQDWQREPALRMCSLAARGLWMEILCLAHEGEPYGHVTVNGHAPTTKQLASVAGVNESEATRLLCELETAGVFSRSETGAIYCRRMVKDRAKAVAGHAMGVNGGNPDLIRGTIPKEERARRYRRGDSPTKTERIFNRTGGRCHWCSVVLQRETAGPDFFHVDHLVAVRDGGTSDENNLVPSCAACNHKRARHDTDHNPDPNQWLGSDDDRPQPVPKLRPQTLEAESESESESEKEEKKQAKKSDSAREARGARLADAWHPSDAGWSMATSLHLDPDATLRDFRDYWTATAGARGRKCDWEATWRRWCRTASERRVAARGPPGAVRQGKLDYVINALRANGALTGGVG